LRKKDWNVNCQAVGDSEGSIKYLAPYVFRVAISDNRIIKVENDKVFLSYKEQKSNRPRTLELWAMGSGDGVHPSLPPHVLTAVFMKVRYYGFLNPVSNLHSRGGAHQN
jgi:hypothetical protein